MKILHLIYSAQVAGAEKYLLNLLPGLHTEGVECDLICVSPEKHKHKFINFCNELNKKGVKTNLITGNKFRFLSIARYINRYLKNNNITYLHTHLFKSDLLAVMVKKIFNKKVFLISTKHGYQEKYLSNYPVNKKKIIYNAYYLISKYLARNIDEHVTISQAMSDLYFNLKIIPRRIKYIYHGIDVAVPVSTNDSKEFCIARPQLIIVGRVEEIKGHKYLFDAMPAIINKFPAIKLLIIGNGTQKEFLLSKSATLGIENNISFLGFRENPYPYIAHSDIIVLPSLFEPFGLVYIEAFALKIPVIAFDVPASNEIIADNETGLLVPLADSKILAEKIIHLLQNPQERNRIAKNGYAKYKDYYNTNRMVKDTVAWYRSIIS